MSGDPKKTQKLISILLIAIFFFMLLGLNDRLSEYFKLARQRDEIATEVYGLQSTEITLRTQIAYASGDNAVEDWARGEAHMALQGDIVIVPLTPSVQSGQNSMSSTPTPSVKENWQIWKSYLFGSD
jgi:cell division protein FtsB